MSKVHHPREYCGALDTHPELYKAAVYPGLVKVKANNALVRNRTQFQPTKKWNTILGKSKKGKETRKAEAEFPSKQTLSIQGGNDREPYLLSTGQNIHFKPRP